MTLQNLKRISLYILQAGRQGSPRQAGRDPPGRQAGIPMLPILHSIRSVSRLRPVPVPVSVPWWSFTRVRLHVRIVTLHTWPACKVTRVRGLRGGVGGAGHVRSLPSLAVKTFNEKTACQSIGRSKWIKTSKRNPRNFCYKKITWSVACKIWKYEECNYESTKCRRKNRIETRKGQEVKIGDRVV